MGENQQTKNTTVMNKSTNKIVESVTMLWEFIYSLVINIKRILQPGVDENSERKDVEINEAMTKVCESFLMFANNFQGVYEPMYKASVGGISLERMRNVLRTWDIRMGNICQPPICLRCWWATVVADSDTLAVQDLQERCQQVVQMILESGIVRDDKNEFVASTDTGVYYQELDNRKIERGQNLRVDSPCWYLPSNPIRIIEKGYCELI